MVVTALAALLLCGASLAAPAAGGAGGDMPRDMGGGSDAAGLEEELHVGAAELAAVPAESRAVLAKVLGRLEGLRGEMEELKAGKARSDERIAQHEYGRPSWRARRARTRRTGRRQRRPSWKTTHSRVGLGSPPRPGGGASLRARAGRWTPAAWASRGPRAWHRMSPLRRLPLRSLPKLLRRLQWGSHAGLHRVRCLSALSLALDLLSPVEF
jgi:hypothetical protein